MGDVALLPALPSRQELQDTTAAWEAFMAGETHGLERVRPVIRASWERCHTLGVDPYLARVPLVVSAEDVEAAQEGADLAAVTIPLFETILQAWPEEKFMLSVSDRHSRLLYTSGHPETLDYARRINAVPGSIMAEELIGTASANVVLAQGRADYVLWNEHFCQGFHAWAAMGAPIFHPLTHEIIGAICSSGEELAHPRALDVIQRFAERIQQLIHHEEIIRRVTLLDAYHRFLLQHPRDIVLAIDGRGHICGASSTIVEVVDAPHNLLDTSFLRLPDLRVEGFHYQTEQQDGRPYGVQIIQRRSGAVLNATAIPVEGERQSVGTLIVMSRSHTRGQRREPTASLWRATYTFADLVGASSVFQKCVTLARQASQSNFPVLLAGETGTGKELLAQAIHTASSRSQGPFVAVNCGIPGDDLLAADLFGYVEGAFTGALKGGRKGKIELAHGGTLFLDEVEAMSPKMQVLLLRVLEEYHVVRVGSERPVSVDIRVIAASNEDLRAAVSQKQFRVDLYHRLCALPIQLPPLRERREDLPLLARHLLKQIGFPHLWFAPETLQLLRRYAWPGNIRELKHVLLRAAQQTTGTTIALAALPQEISAVEELPSPTQAAKSLRDSERELIVQALTDAHGSPTQAASQLGIHRATLYRKLKKYGLSSTLLKALPLHDD